MADKFADEVVALLPNLRRFAMSLTRNGDRADDLVQTAVERAFRNRSSYDTTARLDAWLLRIVRNAWIDEGRRARVRGTPVDVEKTADEAVVVDGEKVTEQSLAVTEALAAIDALQTDQRAVMMLVCVDELSYREAAEVLDIPVGTLMSRLSRARVAVARMLGMKNGRQT